MSYDVERPGSTEERGWGVDSSSSSSLGRDKTVGGRGQTASTTTTNEAINCIHVYATESRSPPAMSVITNVRVAQQQRKINNVTPSLPSVFLLLLATAYDHFDHRSVLGWSYRSIVTSDPGPRNVLLSGSRMNKKPQYRPQSAPCCCSLR